MRISERTSALLALILLVPAPSFGATMAMWLAHGLVGQTIYVLCKIWIVIIPVVWMRWLDRTPVSWSPPKHGGLRLGFAIGLALGAAIVVGYLLVGKQLIDPARVRQSAADNHIDAWLPYLGLGAYLILVNSLMEEYVWRWFVYRKCAVLLPTAAAVPLSALFFTLHHVIALRAQFNWRITLLLSGGVLIGGMLFSWLYQRYLSIWPGYICHALIDVAVLAIGAVLILY